jgi:hypothetical protein
MFSVRTRIVSATLVLVLLGFPTAGLSQQVKVSFRVAPFGSASLTHLFRVDLFDTPERPGVTFPSLTLTKSSAGPEVSNLALTLPDMMIGSTAVASRIGDQGLPRTFVSSPLSGPFMTRQMRGLSFSTAGATPWSLSVGQLDAADASASSDGPAVMALAVSLARTERISFAPRLLVPIGSEGAGRTTVGTGMRAKLNPHLSFVSDVGAADLSQEGWAPVASAGFVGHWARTEIETSVLRGAPAHDTQGAGMVRSLDRELARGQVRPLSGLTISGLASWSRPASMSDVPDTTLGSVGVAFDRLPYGQLAASRQRELTAGQAVDITRLEWHHTAVGGFVVRYTERQTTDRDTLESPQASKLVEVDLPSPVPQHPGSRLNFRAGLSANPSSETPAIRSRLSSRFAVFDDLALAAETELALQSGDGHQPLRTLRLTTDLALMRNTALQFLYTYQAGTPFSFDRAFEARVSRSFSIFGH